MNALQIRFKTFLIIFIAVFAVGVLGFMILEGLSPADALYFMIVTMATVGYGDIYPKTVAGKGLAILVIVMGVGTFLGVIANATEIMLNKREKKTRLAKLNMIIGIFFSGLGTRLLADFSRYDPDLEAIRQDLLVKNDWSEKDFLRVDKVLQNHGYAVEMPTADLGNLRAFLLEQREFSLRLLENPSLLEHESFTDLLLAIGHLAEELTCRGGLTDLPPSDHAHLKGDMKRVYRLLVQQWLHYMNNLKVHYPYLFSLALRTNPFDRGASPIVREILPGGLPQ
jgi:voltage-gated potassium channel